MKFLSWSNQKDAEDSLAAVNSVYGCPYEADNGYRMDRWDNVVASRNDDQWGFFKPEDTAKKTEQELMAVQTQGFTEHAEKPEEFYPEGLNGELQE